MPEDNVTNETAVEKTDLEKVEAAIAALQDAGEDLFAHQIEDLKAKRDELLVEAAAAAKQAITAVETEEQSLYLQYKGKTWEAVKAGALAAIVYKLFFF